MKRLFFPVVFEISIVDCTKLEPPRVGHFCGRESNCQILCRSLELLVWCFQKELNYLFGVSGKVLNYLFGVSEKVTCFCATDNEFPQES